MKKLSITFLTLFSVLMFCTISCSSNTEDCSLTKQTSSSVVKVNFEQLGFNETLAKAVQKDQPVMVDFYSKGCSGCVALDKQVFQDHKLASFINNRFISLKINGDNGEGMELRKKYQVIGYPTVLFLKPNGEELDRICGFSGKDEFVQTLTDYSEGKNMLMGILSQLEKDPNNVHLNMKLALKYTARWEMEKAHPYFVKSLQLNPKVEKGIKDKAMYHIAIFEARFKKNIAPLTSFMADNSDENFYNPGYSNLIDFFIKVKDVEETLTVYEQALSKMPTDSSWLNDYAWFIYKNKIQDKYGRGIEVAKKALVIKPEAANIWDTLAWLYYEKGDKQKALKAIKKAWEFSTEDKKDRFKERWEKIKKKS
jgi:tetratricopeptide (TPR) repeat protein